jgi:hypothetical protein
MAKEELDSFFLENPKLSKNTQKTYALAYNKIVDLLNVDTLNDVPQKDIIQMVKKIDNPNSRVMLINISMNIKKHFENRTDLLNIERERIKRQINENKNNKKEEKKDNLPTRKDLERYLNDLYLDEEYRAFIINYLLLNYYVRNKDLDLIIVTNKEDFKKLGVKGDQNVVYAGSKNIYLRNQYKTFKQYGQKKYAFNSTKFSKAVKKFVEQQNSEEDIVYLLSDKNGNRITNDSIGNYIKRFTLNKLTESDYNKIAVSQVKDMSDYPLLKSISEKRGTSVPTLVSEYNLNIKLTE